MKQKNNHMIKRKYEIEIHDITTDSISVYENEAKSFYDAFLTAKKIQRVAKIYCRRKTEIKKIEQLYEIYTD